MSYLNALSTHDVASATGRALASEHTVEMDRETTRRLAWALFRRFADETIRVKFWFIRKSIRLGDLRPLWELMFGLEPVPPVADVNANPTTGDIDLSIPPSAGPRDPFDLPPAA